MPEIRITISEKNLALLEELKNEWGISSRSKALEKIIDQVNKLSDSFPFTIDQGQDQDATET